MEHKLFVTLKYEVNDIKGRRAFGGNAIAKEVSCETCGVLVTPAELNAHGLDWLFTFYGQSSVG